MLMGEIKKKDQLKKDKKNYPSQPIRPVTGS
jgi:hypothetical protein